MNFEFKKLDFSKSLVNWIDNYVFSNIKLKRHFVL